MVQHGQPVAMKIYTMWKGFDLETPNQLQIKGNISLMHPYPRVTFSEWLSMALTPLNEGKVGFFGAQVSLPQDFGAAGGTICSFAETVCHQGPFQGCLAGGSARMGIAGCRGWGQTTSK